MDPHRRRQLAVWLLIVSLALGHATVFAFLFGWIDHPMMDLITNYLSWLAISLTALDVLFTSDVRVQQEDEG